ncbi:MAG: hypothetical protein F6K19_10965 [Cyanothece sp. SIO1E1]|nr:hypothetical protein [Cyanothece sp. SIO1E1]
MKTHFITAEIDLSSLITTIPEAIEAELRQRGEPLRWAITAVDLGRHRAKVEAVITTEVWESRPISAQPPISKLENT